MQPIRPKVKYRPFKVDYSRPDWPTQARGAQLERPKRARTYGKSGMSLDAITSLWRAQQGKCAICAAPIPAFGKLRAVDHDPATTKVRGMLCKPCNLGIGMFQHDIARLVGAIEYLQRLPKDHPHG